MRRFAALASAIPIGAFAVWRDTGHGSIIGNSERCRTTMVDVLFRRQEVGIARCIPAAEHDPPNRQAFNANRRFRLLRVPAAWRHQCSALPNQSKSTTQLRLSAALYYDLLLSCHFEVSWLNRLFYFILKLIGEFNHLVMSAPQDSQQVPIVLTGILSPLPLLAMSVLISAGDTTLSFAVVELVPIPIAISLDSSFLGPPTAA